MVPLEKNTGASGEPTVANTHTVQSLEIGYDSYNRVNRLVQSLEGSKTKTGLVYGDASKAQRPGLSYGLTVDGIAGTKTLQAMGIFNSSGNSSGNTSSNSSSSTNSNDLNLLSRLVYGEARGEPYSGQVAVAAVVLNRVKNSSFPNTISGVIYQKGAFDVVSDGQINLTPNDTAKKAAQDALNGWDPTNGAIYYFNPSTATNKWIWSRPMTVTIGKHRFCK